MVRNTAELVYTRDAAVREPLAALDRVDAVTHIDVEVTDEHLRITADAPHSPAPGHRDHLAATHTFLEDSDAIYYDGTGTALRITPRGVRRRLSNPDEDPSTAVLSIPYETVSKAEVLNMLDKYTPYLRTNPTIHSE